jgi:S-ribosylhomocysteine lyase LuxS involved in autoinducer biosynthesis
MNNVKAEDIRVALARVYKNVFPLKSKDDIVGLNEVQCGNPGLYAIAATNDAMAQYMRCLYTREQAEEAGIGSIYNPAW